MRNTTFILAFCISILIIPQSVHAIVGTIGPKYFERDSTVYFGEPEKAELAVKVEGAVMGYLRTMESFYAKDDNRVYYRGIVVKQADPNTFQSIAEHGHGYAKDSKHVFYRGELVKDADPETIKIILYPQSAKDNILSKDKNHVYLFAKKTHFDVNTFRVLAPAYFSDKNGVYSSKLGYGERSEGEIKRLKGADPKDCKIVDNYLLTAGTVFLGTQNLKMDAASFTPLDEYSSYKIGIENHISDFLVRDKDRVLLLYENHEFDASTFCILGSKLLCDKNGVYFYNDMVSEKLVRLDLDPTRVEWHTYEYNYNVSILVKDNVNAYYVHPLELICEKIDLENIETLKLKTEGIGGYIFTHQDGEYILDFHKIRKLGEPFDN